VVLECAGVQTSFDTALYSVRGKGTIVNVGIFEKPIISNPNILNRRSLRYVGSNVYTREEFQEVIEAIADGRIERPERLITGRVPLDEAFEQGFKALLQERDKHVKILIHLSS
jgi:threonine dehydrogenase-like Zn-dependent dehydrogenase